MKGNFHFRWLSDQKWWWWWWVGDTFETIYICIILFILFFILLYCFWYNEIIRHKIWFIILNQKHGEILGNGWKRYNHRSLCVCIPRSLRRFFRQPTKKAHTQGFSAKRWLTQRIPFARSDLKQTREIPLGGFIQRGETPLWGWSVKVCLFWISAFWGKKITFWQQKRGFILVITEPDPKPDEWIGGSITGAGLW